MADRLDTEKCEQLIRASGEYTDAMTKHKQTLQDATDSCEQVMKDDVFKKHKPRLQQAIGEMSKSITQVAQIKEQLEKILKEIKKLT